MAGHTLRRQLKQEKPRYEPANDCVVRDSGSATVRICVERRPEVAREVPPLRQGRTRLPREVSYCPWDVMEDE